MEEDQTNFKLVVPYTPHARTPPGAGTILSQRSYAGSSFFVNNTPLTSMGSIPFINTPISFTPINTPDFGVPLSGTRKRPRRESTTNDENMPLTRAVMHPKEPELRITSILASIHDQGWTLGEFLYQIFDHRGRNSSRDQTHAQMVKSFLGGKGKYTPSDILAFWMSSPDGVLHAHDPDLANMFSTDTPYTEIGPVRAALTSFALQTVGNHLARGAERDVQASSGLQVSLTSKNPAKKSGWLRIGENTIPFVSDVLYNHLKPAFYLLEQIAVRKSRTRDGVVMAPRKHRPARGVIVHVLADLLFCRTDNANLLPLARGILYFGCSVPADIMAYNSRIGTMPSYSTIRRHLEGLSSEEALVTSAHGSDPTKAGILLFDNVQNLARVRDHRIGRENHMNVGMSGLWVETWKIINIHVFDLSDKRQRITYSERANLSVDRLVSFLDQEDADTTGYRAWLEVLVHYTKPLKSRSAEVKARYSRTAKLVIPVERSVVHQVGQTAASYIPRKLVIGGDGLSYAMLLQLQSYLQWHKDAFQSFEILEPQLQVWHLKWTDIIRIFQTHWGRTSGKSTNPASLGHSAGKIGRSAPSNMKKVEFYPGSQLLYLVLDARMLDCWSCLLLGTDDIFEYFESLSKQDKLPDLEELYMLFTFAGSTHSNYLNYVLETIVNLELESSPGLKEALLLCLLVNIRGLAGHFEEGDYVVEFFNRLLEDIVQHKNAQFDDSFIRNVVSRSLRHIAELKLAWRTSTGMAAKSHVHSDPHTKPEMRTLLKLYRTEELHSRRMDRQIDDRNTDDFAKGLKKLREGALKKFIDKSRHTRQPRQRPTALTTSISGAVDSDTSDGSSSEESDDDSDTEATAIYATRGSMSVVDGELVMDERDMMDGPEEEIIPDPESDEDAEEDAGDE
ncbi:hypothetical protein B0H13DRAFT_2318024 [Mycena leptocephala]|nr:hypothetical protein B0H13DRAFT_2318024 [Mycena leptocephala]